MAWLSAAGVRPMELAKPRFNYATGYRSLGFTLRFINRRSRVANTRCASRIASGAAQQARRPPPNNGLPTKAKANQCVIEAQ